MGLFSAYFMESALFPPLMAPLPVLEPEIVEDERPYSVDDFAVIEFDE